MVDIAFTPALGEAIEVPISDCCDELDTVAVRFAAALGYREYQQVVEGQLKVQVWSDIASPDAHGGWRAYDFDVARSPPAHDAAAGVSMPATSTAGTRVRLAGPSPSSGGHDEPSVRGGDEKISQRLEASIPVSVRNARNFSFTYRFVYPSGDIRWLGTYGHNGYAVVVRESLRGLNLSKGWSEAGRVFTLDEKGSPVTIAAFENIEEYDVWSFPRGLSSPESSSGTDDAELLLAIPREFGVYTRNPSYVIHASSGAVMHLDTSAAAIQAHGTGNITVHACYDLSRLQSLLHLLPLESGGRVELRVVPQEGDESKKCLVVSSTLSSRGKAPVKVVIIPIGQMQLAEVEVRLGIESLIGGLPKDVGQIALATENTSDIQFLKPPFGEQTCTFVVPKHGGEFLLSPVYDFDLVVPYEKDDEYCQVALLAPHAADTVTVGLEGVVTLPTPPPSPQIPLVKKQPQPHVSFAQRAEVIPSTPTQQPSGTPARELRQRRQASSTRAVASSASEESGRPNPDTTSPPASRTSLNPFALLSLFVWIRYAILLLRLLVGGRTKEWRGKETIKAIVDVPDRPHVSPDESSREDKGKEEEEQMEDDDVALPEEPSAVTDSDDHEDAQEIHAPKPSLPSHKPSSKVIRALYAELCFPSASPFGPTASQHRASLVIFLRADAALPGSASGITPISSLHKVLTVNGEVPGDLEVVPLGKEEDKDVRRYLVKFSVPSDGVASPRLRVAEMV